MNLLRIAALCLLPALSAPAALTPKQKADNLASFELIWSTVRDRHPDPAFNGLNWQAVHDETLPKIRNADSMEAFRAILRDMLDRLGTSHYGIVPSHIYQPSGQAVTLGKASEGEKVSFGNLPPVRVRFESKTLDSGAGYIAFNYFLNPVTIMPQFEKAMQAFAHAPGVILDLRGNPGGIGFLATGIAGFFFDQPGLSLGEMKTQDLTLKFSVFPRPDAYAGPLAILVDGGSASTSEIFAAGMQDLKRARIFGSRTAGAALPSDFLRLPDGDGFQFALATYRSQSGKVLEQNGVTPDVEIPSEQSPPGSGQDPVIQAAEAWIRGAIGDASRKGN